MDSDTFFEPRRSFYRLSSLFLAIYLLTLFGTIPVNAANEDFDGARVDSVSVLFSGGKENSKYRDVVLKTFSTVPGERFNQTQSDIYLSKVKQLNFIKTADYSVQPTGNGDLAIVLNVVLSDLATSLSDKPIGVFGKGSLSDFPTLYADDRTVFQGKLENRTMFFSNTNAFFGNPDVLTAGNPLAESASGSDGTDSWLESSIEAGVYAISSLADRVSVFGGVSYIESGSVGDELFTDKTRTHGGFEDAYFGTMGSDTTSSGGIRQVSVLYGRKSFQVDSGMILRLSSANGGDRASLQSNPRNAAESLFHLQFVYDKHRMEIFRLDPDELEQINTQTIVHGINYEVQAIPATRIGVMFLKVPESKFSYYTTDATYSRKGLRVYDLRAAYEPTPDVSKFYIRGELAKQTNEYFDMNAHAGYAEIGYNFTELSWKPTPSYRYSFFSGDKSGTSTYERWDPLYAGGSGDEWVQGLNEYKVIQTSNVIAHRFMLRFQPSPRWDFTPQLWFFRADNLNNLGGAQALSMLQSYDLGRELNITARYVSSRNLIFVFSAAYTQPGEAIKLALNNDYKNWFSSSALMIFRF